MLLVFIIIFVNNFEVLMKANENAGALSNYSIHYWNAEEYCYNYYIAITILF